VQFPAKVVLALNSNPAMNAFAVFASVDPGVESVLLTVLTQLMVIILAARVFAWVFRKLGQPSVVGEIAAGLMLGPSVLGKFFPAASAMVFDPAVKPVFSVLSQVGLIFLLFLIGLEFDFSHLRARSRAAVLISVMGIVPPFALGWLLAQWLHPHLEMAVDPRGFALFMGTAMSITAIPILGRMMMELNITRTRIGAITITAAAVDDATGWIILAAISAMVRAGFDLWLSVRMFALTVGFAALMIFVVRPLLRRWIRSALRRGDGELGLNSLAILVVIIFLGAIATNVIGIFAIFGAFIVGSVLSDEHEFRAAVTRQLRNFVTVFFLPIFFTYTGLNTDIGTLGTPTLWLFAAAVSLVAIAGKFGGCSIAAWASGFSLREAGCIGIMMNTRALMELIVINVGYELKVIPPSVFCMLVMMALLTTVMTTPILLRLQRNTELEPWVADSSFGTAGRTIMPDPEAEVPVTTQEG
jgi:Kef-type K+ transport system membrane component KefB